MGATYYTIFGRQVASHHVSFTRQLNLVFPKS